MTDIGKVAVIGLAFGKGVCDANREIAETIRQFVSLQKNFTVEVIVQDDVAQCLPDIKSIVISEHKEKPGAYLDTYEVMRQAKEVISSQGIVDVVIVAHPSHYPRCAAVAKRMGLRVVPLIELNGIPYNRRNEQKWTTSPLRWWPRELLARIVYFVEGYIGFWDLFRF